jgi:putative ATP-dependent endonuclease of OLD family
MYLSKVVINNFRGIKSLSLDFDSKINIIIGENASNKSALVDAIRLLYNIGKQKKDIFVSKEDFCYDTTSGKELSPITIEYEFRDLSDEQKGAFYEYMVIHDQEDYIKINLNYELRDDKIYFVYNTGNVEGQKADSNTFNLFQHYFLGALRDSTRDLLNTRGNILGGLIQRLIDKNKSKKNFEDLIIKANDELLRQDEVVNARDSINDNLKTIFQNFLENKIGLNIENSKVEYLVNIIKPFLPFDRNTLAGDGFNIWQNSLGFNNLIYIATVLGDINQRVIDDKISHYSLLIEEPEAHLHPQLQLSLYNFLCATSTEKNSQLFITSHSPTLTSKVPLDKLIVMNSSVNSGIKINSCFENREGEGLKESEDVVNNDILTFRKKQLERYIDVTKSQLFYARSIIFVEGISEELLFPTFAEIQGFKLEDFRIELVNIDGTSFYPFIYLFNSNIDEKKLIQKISIVTDDDRFPDSKKSDYSFSKIIEDNTKLEELLKSIDEGEISARISNLEEIKNKQDKIIIASAYKTFEYELILNNINFKKADFEDNSLIDFLKIYSATKVKYIKIKEFVDNISDEILSDSDKKKITILLWKAISNKAEFAQDFSIYLLADIAKAKKSFNVPDYIKKAFNHLIS